MIIEETKLEGIEIAIADLDEAMAERGFVRWSWDYKRATYDYKYEDKKAGQTYYLRVPCIATVGEIEEVGSSEDTFVRVEAPYIGRHTYPHGFDYDYNFPSHVLTDAKKRLDAVTKSF